MGLYAAGSASTTVAAGSAVIAGQTAGLGAVALGSAIVGGILVIGCPVLLLGARSHTSVTSMDCWKKIICPRGYSSSKSGPMELQKVLFHKNTTKIRVFGDHLIVTNNEQQDFIIYQSDIFPNGDLLYHCDYY
jgi:hypothetical protein